MADAEVEALQGSLCRLDAADEVQKDLHSLRRCREELRFVDLAHALLGTVSDEAYCQKVSSLDSIAINEIVRLAYPYLSLFSRNIDTVETRHSPFACARNSTRGHHRYSPISRLCPTSKTPYSTATATDPRGR